MKKVLLTLSCIALSLGAFAQTIVSTQTEKRHLFFEEYTGVNCGYCPNGHAMLSQVAEQVPGTVVVNIHQGSYAAAYTTQWGNTLASQVHIKGYPAFAMNRKVGSNDSVTNYYGSSAWNADMSAIIAENSPVNVAATATIDKDTRTMNVHVEVYYTANVNRNANYLQVMLLQDYVVGEQYNYGGYNPTQILDNGKYIHMHMLRDMITGSAWGDKIAVNEDGVIPAGTYVEKDYTYQIPASISNEDVVLTDINLAVLVSDVEEGTITPAPNIWTGVKVQPDLGEMTDVDIQFFSFSVERQLGCKNYVVPSARIRNRGVNITSLVGEVKNISTGDVLPINYTQPIAFNEDVILEFDNLPIAFNQQNNIQINLTSANGTPINFTKSVTYSQAEAGTYKGNVQAIIRTDNYGSELMWGVLDGEGNYLYKKNNYQNGSSTRDTVWITIPEDGCYTFIAVDSYGDGQTVGTNGYVRLYDGEGNRIANFTGQYSEKVQDFKINGNVGLNDANGVIAQSILYPNPACEQTTLAIDAVNAAKAEVMIVDLMGRVVLSLGQISLVAGQNNVQINTSSLSEGAYFVRTITNDGMTTNRLNIVK